MADVLTEEIINAINKEGTLKSIASVDQYGIPHIVYKGSLHINEDGNLEFNEVLEDSKNSKNMVGSLWLNKKVAVQILTVDFESYEIIGTVERAVTSGSKFEEVYKSLISRSPDSGLSAIWTIIPESVRNESFKERLKQSRNDNPYLRHLDRFVSE